MAAEGGSNRENQGKNGHGKGKQLIERGLWKGEEMGLGAQPWPRDKNEEGGKGGVAREWMGHDWSVGRSTD